jgi:hypothetical protein
MEKTFSKEKTNKNVSINNISVFDLDPRNNSLKTSIKFDSRNEIDSYYSKINDQLKLFGYSLESRGSIQTVADILDRLSQSNKFNKTIFFHILEFAAIDPDSNILLSDFFRSFFNAYESMKSNRDRISEQLIHNSQIKEVNNNKKLQIQNTETIFENGLTNNSIIKISILNLEFINDNDKIPNIKDIILEFTIFNKSQMISMEQEARKTDFAINSLNSIDKPLRIFLNHEGNSIFVEKFNIRDLLETPYIYKLVYQGVSCEIKLLWINSKVNYYNKKMISLDEKIAEDNENMIILNNCIYQIEGKKFISSFIYYF